MINKKYISFVLIILFVLIALFGIKQIIKNFASDEQIELIKKYIYPYRRIAEQERAIVKYLYDINYLRGLNSRWEIGVKNSKKNITIGKSKDLKLTNGKILKKFIIANGFYSGIWNPTPGTGFIDFHKDNLFVLSSRGILAYSNNIENELSLRQIENNINEFIGIEQFNKSKKFSLKDLYINQSKIYISYTEEKEKDCWTTSIIFSEVNYVFTEFKKLFSNKECINSMQTKDGAFNAHQAGGRIVSYDDDHILFSTGDYKERYLAQDESSIFGKIIRVNINNSDYEIISMGHRNPQGLLYDKEKNFILETEHGPMGGDEINLIEVNPDPDNENKLPNYGWPVVSAGEHYGGRTPKNKKLYDKYPLYKSHKQHGFIEPLISFVPSIAISEIVKINENKFVVSSLKDKSIYFFKLNDNKEIINLERVEVFERIRDLKYKDNKLYFFLEDTASIGIVNF